MSDRFTSHSRFGEIYNGKRGDRASQRRGPGIFSDRKIVPISTSISVFAAPFSPFLIRPGPVEELKRAGVQTQSGLERRLAGLLKVRPRFAPSPPKTRLRICEHSLPELSGQGQRRLRSLPDRDHILEDIRGSIDRYIRWGCIPASLGGKGFIGPGDDSLL